MLLGVQNGFREKKYNNEAPVKLKQIVDNDRVGDSVLCTVMIFKAS